MNKENPHPSKIVCRDALSPYLCEGHHHFYENQGVFLELEIRRYHGHSIKIKVGPLHNIRYIHVLLFICYAKVRTCTSLIE